MLEGAGPNGKNLAPELHDSLVRQLQARILGPLKGGTGDRSKPEKKIAHAKMVLVSLFYRIAVQSRPRHTMKLRQTEDPWLEKLLHVLDDVASAVQSVDSSNNAQ